MKTFLRTGIKTIASTTFMISLGISAYAQISSDFNTNSDGWVFFNGFSGASTPGNHQATGGNPGGFVSFTYSSNIGSVQSWRAPSKFLGNQVVRSLGQLLRFDLQQSLAGTNSNGSGDVRIIGTNGVTIVFSLATKPAVAPAWSSYAVRLDETQGWRISSTTGTLATRTDIIGVLTNIQNLEIRGTYITNASYTSGLDNVVLEQKALATPPTITSFSPGAANVGDNVTITGTNLPTGGNLMVWFGGVRASVTSSTATQVIVTVPQGARYSPITVVNTATGVSASSMSSFIPTFAEGGRIIPSSFGERIDFTINASPGNTVNGIDVADIDADGWNDLAVTQNIGTVLLYRNKGLGGTLSASSFDSPVEIAGVGNETGLKFIDLDGDGKLDIAGGHATASVSTFTTMRNTSTPGSISFEPFERWNGLVYSGYFSSVVDVDSDGRPDLIGQHGNGSVNLDLWIAQNISSPGDIEFARSVSYFGSSTLDAGAGVSVGDLNADGKPELVVKYAFGGSTAILENTSSAGVISFNTPVTSTQGANGTVSIADVNNDNKPDLIYKDGFSNNDIIVALNANNGATIVASDFSTTFIIDSELINYGTTAIGDLNGDGKIDIVITDPTNIGVFENNFSSSFSNTSFIPAYALAGGGASTYPMSINVADLNGDGKPELVAGLTNGSSSDKRFFIFENKNKPTPVIAVNTVSPLAAPVGSTITITGDNFSTTPSENIVRFGSVRASVLSSTKTSITATVPAGANHRPVSVTRNQLTSRYRLPSSVTFSSGVNFNGTHFASPVEFTAAGADYDIDISDFDGDGKPDIYVEGGTNDYFFRNTHTSGQVSSTSLTLDETLTTAMINPNAEDFDGDGLPEMASANGSLLKNSSSAGNISFQSSVSLGIGGGQLTFQDFNRDGKFDMAGSNGGTAQIFVKEYRDPETANLFSAFSGSFGTFSGNVVFNKAALGGAITSGDFDGDGFDDILAPNPSTDNISIFRNTGRLRISTASFTRTDLAVGDNPGRIYSGDFDRDGKLDALLVYPATTTSNFVTVLHNQSTSGTITFARIDIPLGVNGASLGAIDDLDGDGRPDLIVAQEASNRFSIFKNIHTSGALSASSFASPFHTTVTAPRGLNTADLNADGKPEIIITRAAGFLLVYENLITAGPQITGFNPAGGPEGSTTVTISGSGFDPIAANNTVAFNGTTATVISATVNTIVTTVPLGATTGPITVVVGGNTATSGTNFIVTPCLELIASTFDNSADGWTTLNGAAGDPVFVSIGGNPGGFLRGFDFVGGVATFMSAPVKFLGNKSGAYGQLLRFDLQNNTATSATSTNGDIRITGGGITIFRNIDPPLPAITPAWSSHSVRLDETANWRVGSITGAIATQAQIKTVLASLTTILINVEYSTFFGDTGGIDNVILEVNPVSITSFTPTLGIPGNAVSVAGTGFHPTLSRNVLQFNTTTATVTSGTLTTLSTSVPNGATTGPLRIAVNGCPVVPSATDFFVDPPPTSADGALTTNEDVNFTFQASDFSFTDNGTFAGIEITTVESAGDLEYNGADVGIGTICADVTQLVFRPASNANGSPYATFRFRIRDNAGNVSASDYQMTISVTPVNDLPTSANNTLTTNEDVALTFSAASFPFTDVDGTFNGIEITTTETAGDLELGGTDVTSGLLVTDVTQLVFRPNLNESGSPYATFTFRVRDNSGTLSTAAYVLTINVVAVNDAPVITGQIPVTTPEETGITIIPSMLTVSDADNATFTVSVNDGQNYSRSGNVITPATNFTGTLTVPITVSDGITASQPFNLVVTVTNTNDAPTINAVNSATEIEGKVVINLQQAITDPDNNLDFTTLRISVPPSSGASFSIDASYLLTIDYRGISFSGTDRFTIEICDLNGVCTQQEFLVQVTGDITVYNGISPNNDGQNDFWLIEYVTLVEGAAENEVTILNRWGDEVWSGKNYNNETVVFTGKNKNGNDLPAGTYFYKITFKSGRKALTGYLSLKR